MPLIDLTGQSFGRLTVLRLHARVSVGVYSWDCRCSCGHIKILKGARLRYGKTISCGCARVEHARSLGARNRLRDGDAAMNAVWSRYQSSAATRGLRFELSRARFVQLVTRACFYCGQAPREVPNRKTSLRLNGIDRVDNTRGYTEDNVRSCCITCNTGKLRQTQQEFYAWTTRVHEALNADPPDDHYFAQFEGADE